MEPSWRRYIAGVRRHLPRVGLGALIFGALYQALCHTEAFADDAAISFAYSSNLAQSGELIHTPSSERVEGFSNPSWTVLCALAVLLRMNPYIFARAMGVMCLVGTIVLVYRSAERLFRRSTAARIAAPVLAAMTPAACFWTMAGLETPLIALLLSLLVWQAIREEREGARGLSGLVVAALAVSRPEGLIYAGPLALYKLLFVLRAPPGDRWPALRRHAANLLGLLIPVTLFVLWRRLYFGAWLPNTYFAKLATLQLEGDDATDESRGLRYIKGFFRLNHLWPLVYASPLVLLVRRRGPEMAFLLALVSTHLFFVYWVDGDWMGDFRFFALAMPLYALLLGAVIQGAGDALRWLGERLRRPLSGEHLARLLSVGLLLSYVAGSLLPTLAEYSRMGWVSMELVRHQATGLELLARRSGQLRATVAVPDVGGSALFGNIRIVDTAGLVDPIIGRFKGRPGRIRRYLFEEARPDLYQQHSHWGRYFNFSDHFEFRRDYVELPQKVTKRMVLLGEDFIRREHLTGHPVEIEQRLDRELGRGLTLRGGDGPMMVGRDLVVQLYVETNGERPRPGDRIEVALRPEPEDQHAFLSVDLTTIPVDLFAPGELLRLRFGARGAPTREILIRGPERATGWLPVSTIRAGERREAEVERLLLYPRTHFACVFPSDRRRRLLRSQGRLQVFDGCEPLDRPAQVDGLVRTLHRRARASLEVGSPRASIFLLGRAELLRPTSPSIRRLSRQAAVAAHRAALVQLRRGDLEGARRLTLSALEADPLLSRARKLDIDLVDQGLQYFPDRRERAEVSRQRVIQGDRSPATLRELLEAHLAADRLLPVERLLDRLGSVPLDEPELAVLAARISLGLGLCGRTMERLEVAGEPSSCEHRWAAFRARQICAPTPDDELAPPRCQPHEPTDQPFRSLFEFEDERLAGWSLSAPLVQPEGRPRRYTSGFSGARALRTGWISEGVAGSFTARSPAFEIDDEAISLQVGGGRAEDGVRVALLVEGREVRSGAGRRDQHLRRLTWDVSELRGRTARLVIRDEGAGRWGHLMVDHVRTHPLALFDPDRMP